jgi:hypothetical protein
MHAQAFSIRPDLFVLRKIAEIGIVGLEDDSTAARVSPDSNVLRTDIRSGIRRLCWRSCNADPNGDSRNRTL